MLNRLPFATFALVLCMVLLCTQAAPARAAEPAARQMTVYAAASTQPVLAALAPRLSAHRLQLRAVHGGSATLARQIELGAPDVDVFISANRQWMDHLDNLGLLEPGTRRDVATNRLVLVASASVPQDVTVDLTDARNPAAAITHFLNGGRLAIAEPNAVPAGIYAKQALQALGAWDALKDHLAPARDVTGALLLVSRGEAPLGVVYRSDLGRVDGVRVAGVFPAASHAPIVYQAALLKGRAGGAGQDFLDILTGPEGQAAFAAAGFGAAP